MAKKEKVSKEKINEVISPEIEGEVIPEIKETEAKKKVLSAQAKNWEAYLKATKVTPEEFIARFPNHKFISYIKELVD